MGGKNPVLVLDPAAAERLGRWLAGRLEPGMVIHLRGDLGAGKTSLVRAVLQGLGVRGPVRSPSYTLVESYDVGGRSCHHLDLYRLGDPEELEWLGLRDLLAGPAVLFVEWPERGGALLPAPDLEIRIEHAGDRRRYRLRGPTARGAALLAGLPADLETAAGA